MAISATVSPGKIFSDNESVTIAKLNALGTPTVDISGAVGSLSISDNSITDAKIQSGAAIQFSKMESVDSAKIIVGNSSNVPTAVTMSGDATISNTGAVTVSSVANDCISLQKLNHQTQGDILYYGASGTPSALSAGTSGQFLKTQGSGANPVWSDLGVTTPSVTVSSDNTALDDDTDVTVPADTFLVIGTLKFTMSGSTGAKAQAQIKDSSGTVLDTVVLGGGNETNGNDGGSGMTVRDSFTIGVPSNCATVRIYKGAGSNSMEGEVTQFVKLS
tara:strand:+ start:1475 stop:2299 length:825 start_codon:yes stop_codon:yes gene_type:complete